MLPTSAPFDPVPMSLSDLTRTACQQVPWLWQGYLAQGNLTLLISQWKAGKTTLVSILLHHLKAGGQLAGLPIRPGKAVILTEESPDLWLERSQHFDYADQVQWFCRPFRGKPALEQWWRLVDQVEVLYRQLGVDLLVIDPLASFLPGRDENNAGPIMEFLTSLQQLTSAGMAVLLLHHPRKQAAPDGQSARGSGALTGFADILIEMHWFSRADSSDRRRQLLAWSRYRSTPRQLVIELNEAGTDYGCLGSRDDVYTAQLNAALHAVLTAADYKLNIKEILELWPPAERRPAPNVLWRWLDRAVCDGVVLRDGAGHKRDPFCYWLPQMEAVWRQDPLLALRLDSDASLRECYQLIGETL